MTLGDLDIRPVIDGTVWIKPSEAYASIGPSNRRGVADQDWLPHQNFLTPDGLLEHPVGGFLVRIGDRTVVVDAGLGELETNPSDGARYLDEVAEMGITPSWIPSQGGCFLNELARLGVQPEDVTDVVLTHLHFDHIGWAAKRDEAVFKNAVYRCDARDWAHFVGSHPGVTKKLLPIESRVETWEGTGPLLPGLDTLSAPGHTPGSTILVLSSGIHRAMLLGDVVHCAVELLDDEWSGMGDVDPDMARRTRVALARELEGTGVPAAASHFPQMQFGRLLRGQGKRSWVFG